MLTEATGRTKALLFPLNIPELRLGTFSHSKAYERFKMVFKCFVSLLFLLGGFAQGQFAGNEGNRTGMSRMGRFMSVPLEKWITSCGSRHQSINFVSSNYKDCIQRHGFPYDALDFDSRMSVSYRSGAAAAADNADEICSMIKAMADCAHEVTNDLGACLSQEAMKEVKTVFDSFHYSMCAGKMLLKKMHGSTSALECFVNNAESTLRCMSSRPELVDQWFMKITRTSRTIYTDEYCAVQKENKKCLAPLRDRCQDKITPELFEAAVKSLDGATPRCNSAAAFKLNLLNILVFSLVSVLLRKFSSN